MVNFREITVQKKHDKEKGRRPSTKLSIFESFHIHADIANSSILFYFLLLWEHMYWNIPVLKYVEAPFSTVSKKSSVILVSKFNHLFPFPLFFFFSFSTLGLNIPDSPCSVCFQIISLFLCHHHPKPSSPKAKADHLWERGASFLHRKCK